MHECGDSLLLNLNPNFARAGVFVEKHACPLCRDVFEITFEGTSPDDDLVCQVVRVATRAEKRYAIPARAG
jgi:hypothetical protein